MKTLKTLKRMMVAGAVVGAVLAVVLAVTIHTAFAQQGNEPALAGPQVTQVNSNYFMAVVIAASLAAGFGFLGGGYAVAKVGAAALGSASERPEMLVRSLVFVALGEGIAIFGLVVSIMLILKLPK
jgi:V/A-type H+/Na+-transporting ATPase subunit K